MKPLFFIFSILVSLAFQAQEEYIRFFHSELQVDTSGLLAVTETIEVYDAGNQIQRGIVRSLPMQGIDYCYRQVKNDYQIIRVDKDGSSEPFHTKKRQGDFYIYIGDRDVFLDPGFYSYSITYNPMGQLGYFDDYDEIYWNINGFGWNLRVEKISATVSIPAPAEFNTTACYTGYSGSTDQHCQVEKLPDGRLYFQAEKLGPNQNLRIFRRGKRRRWRRRLVNFRRPEDHGYFRKIFPGL